MPIYEYVCGSCGHQLEALQKMSDAPLVDCPACSKSSLSKQISAAGFRLKGGGWYETDYKSGNKKNLAGDSGSPAKSDSAAPAKSDSAAPAKSGSAAPAKSSSGASS